MTDEVARSPASDPEVRKTGLGASDAAPAMGLSKWQTPLELYLEKRGVIDTSDIGEREAVQMGILLEPVILQHYAVTTERPVAMRHPVFGVTAIHPDGRFRDAPPAIGKLLDTARHPERSWQMCHVDGIGFEGDEPKEIVEAKSSLGRLAYSDEWGEEDTDELPGEYVAQGQHQIEVIGALIGRVVPVRVPVILAGPRWRVYTVHRSESFAVEMNEMEDELWTRIRLGQAPDPTPDRRGEKALDLLYPTTKGEERVVAPTEKLHRLAHELHELKSVKKAYDEEVKLTQNAIKKAMGEDIYRLVGPDWKATWSVVQPKPKTDWEAAFKELAERVSSSGLEGELARSCAANHTQSVGSYRRFLFTPGKELKADG